MRGLSFRGVRLISVGNDKLFKLMSEVNKLVKKSKTIYVTLNKPHPLISDESRVYYIDAVMKRQKTCNSKCEHLSGPQSLTELSIAITKAMSGGYHNLVLDSVSTLLIYNDVELTERFIHYLVNRLRAFNMNALLITVQDDKSMRLFNSLCQISDGCIKE